MPNKNKYVAGWRTAYTTPPIDTTSSHQPTTTSDKYDAPTPQESPQNAQPPYPSIGKATIDVEPCPHLQALRAAKEARERKVWKKRAEEKVKGGGKNMNCPRVTPATAQHPKNLQAGLTYAPPTTSTPKLFMWITPTRLTSQKECAEL